MKNFEIDQIAISCQICSIFLASFFNILSAAYGKNVVHAWTEYFVQNLSQLSRPKYLSNNVPGCLLFALTQLLMLRGLVFLGDTLVQKRYFSW